MQTRDACFQENYQESKAPPPEPYSLWRIQSGEDRGQSLRSASGTGVERITAPLDPNSGACFVAYLSYTFF